jgi:hypothetical protein
MLISRARAQWTSSSTTLMGQYMQASDNLAADGLVSGAGASGATWTVTANDPSSLISAIYTSAYNILLATNFLPDHIFVAPGVWQALGAQLDVDKRPVFPYVGAADRLVRKAATADGYIHSHF